MAIFKSLLPSDVRVVPFPAYYDYSYTYESGSVNNSPDVNVSYGENFENTGKALRLPNTTYELFDSVIQNFYSAIPYATYGTKKSSYVPEESVYVVSIVQTVYGENVLPGTFSSQVNGSKLEDDGKGNLVFYSSGTGSIVGRVFYDKGIALIKQKDKPNLNPDPAWADGNSNDGPGGWEFLIETASTETLGIEQGVTERYPGPPTIAAKVATRTGTYLSGGGFYKQSVSTNKVYHISGWVYAGATTLRARLNNNQLGADYPMGYILTYLDSSDNVVDYEVLKTTAGASGWNYLSRWVKITNPSIAKFTMGTFIDGPYPAGYGYGDPVCSDEYRLDPLKCPGYAWFAGFKIVDLSTSPSVVGLDQTGLYITGGMSITNNFTSSLKLYENIIKVKVEPAEFLYPLNNPSLYGKMSGSTQTPANLLSSQSLKPYVTTIGLYNDQNELLLVAKPSVPIQRSSDVGQTFVIRYDIS